MLQRLLISLIVGTLLSGCSVNIRARKLLPGIAASSAEISREWEHAVRAQGFTPLEGTDASCAGRPAVASNDSGQAIIVWGQNDGNYCSIYKAERAANGVWTLPTSLVDKISPHGREVLNTTVAMNSAGQVLVSWRQRISENGNSIFKAERAASGTWTLPASLTDKVSLSEGALDYPAIDLNSAGEAIIAWAENGNGLFKAERATNGTWTLPANLADNIPYGGQYPAVALNSSGQAIVTWTRSDGAHSQIFKAERATNGTWTTPVNLADNLSPNGQNAQYPQATLNAAGESVITWRQSDGANLQIFKAERATNGTWTVPANLADNLSPDGQDTFTPQVALNTLGEAIIAWHAIDGTEYQVFIAERAANGTWTVPASLADNISLAGDAREPVVALNSVGEALIAWQQPNGSGLPEIFKAERAVGGAWTGPASLADHVSPVGQPAYTPVVALNASAEAVIAWNSIGIFKAERAAGGAWTVPADTTDSISPKGHTISGFAVALNPAGQAITAWLQSDGLNYQVYKAERAADGTWTLPSSLADHISFSGSHALRIALALNDSGQAIITWQQNDGAFHQVYKAERAANGTWTLPSSLADHVSPDGCNRGDELLLGLNDSGQAIIAWSQEDGTNRQAYKAERATNGAWTSPVDQFDNLSPDGMDVTGLFVELNSAGQAIATWIQSDGSNTQAFKAERAANGAWTLPANLSDHISPAGQDVTGLVTEMNAAGQVVMAWSESDGMNTQIFKAERAANGTWTLPADTLENLSPDGIDAYSPVLSLNSAGQAIVVWDQSGHITKAERAADGTWTVPADLADNLSIDGQNAWSSAVVMNSIGQVVVTWAQMDGSHTQVYKAERAADGTWTKPTSLMDRVSPSGQSIFGTPLVALNSLGEAVIVWRQSDGTNYQIFEANRAVSGHWTLPAITGGIFGNSSPAHPRLLSNMVITDTEILFGYATSVNGVEVSESR